MYAIFRSGSHQYRAEVGSIVDVERLPQEVDDSFEISDVLLIGDGENTVIGQPVIDGARLKVTVLDQGRGEKIIVFKYRQRTNYRVKRGHRQYFTRLRVDEIIV